MLSMFFRYVFTCCWPSLLSPKGGLYCKWGAWASPQGHETSDNTMQPKLSKLWYPSTGHMPNTTHNSMCPDMRTKHKTAHRTPKVRSCMTRPNTGHMPNTTRNSICPEMRTNHASQNEGWNTELYSPWVCWRMQHAYAALEM